MIKASLHEMLPVYHKLFNSILNIGTMSRLGVVVLLHRCINQEEEVIQQITGEFVFQAVWENFSVLC